MTPDEVAQMKNDECIVFIKGKPAFKGKKYPLEKHPNYKLTGDYNKKLMFKYWENSIDVQENFFFDNKEQDVDLYEIDVDTLNNELDLI